MHPALRTRLTYANVVSTVCLFILVGGTAYAAVTITGKNVKNSSLTGTDIRNSSLTTSDVKNRSLLAADFKTGQLPAGAQGPTGPRGAKGDRGPSGATNVVVRSVYEADGSGVASCTAGEVATGGGVGADNHNIYVSQSEPTSTAGVPDGWQATLFYRSTGNAGSGTVYVVCASP